MNTTNVVLPTVDLSAELQNRLLTVMDWIGESAKTGVDLASRELPLLLKEIAIYGAVSNWLMVIVCSIPVVILTILVYNRKNKPWSNNYGPSPRSVFAALLFLVAIPCTLTAFDHIDDAVKATFAPRVYVIEWSVEQIRKIR